MAAVSQPLDLPTSRPLRVLAGPALHNAVGALAASGVASWLIGARLDPAPAVDGWLASADPLARWATAMPVAASVVLAGVLLLASLVALYDATRSWALPASAADAAWWVAVGPWAFVAWTHPLVAACLLGAALVLAGLARDRYLPAAAGATLLTLAVPGGALASAAVVAHYLSQRSWRQGPASTVAALVALAAPLATAAWQAAAGSSALDAAALAWWGAPPTVPPLPVLASLPDALPWAAGVLALLGAGAVIARPRRAPAAARALAVTAIAVALYDAATTGRAATWLPVVAIVPLLAALAEQRRVLARVLWVAGPLAALALAA